MKKTVISFLIFVALSLSGCVIIDIKDFIDGSDEGTVFAYGYMDFSEYTKIRWMSLKQVSPLSADGEMYTHRFWVSDGYFFLGSLVPGSYQIDSFGPSSASFYIMGAQAEVYRLKEPGIYFMGNLKYIPTGDLINKKFIIIKPSNRTEKEILAEVIKRMPETSKWYEPLQKKLNELEGKK